MAGAGSDSGALAVSSCGSLVATHDYRAFVIFARAGLRPAPTGDCCCERALISTPARAAMLLRGLLDGDFGALARGFGDFFYAGVYYFADGFEEFEPRIG